MEIKTKSEIRITVGNNSSSKFLSFDKPVRLLELTSAEASQIGRLLNGETRTNTAMNPNSEEVINVDDSAGILSEVEREAKQYMNEHCFTGHDFSHVLRVKQLCNVIGKAENADMLVLYASALLHDLGRDLERRDVAVDHAGKSAEIAKGILQKINFPRNKIPAVLYAIRVHRFSKGTSPTTLEAKILQDADRLDISGAIGIATTFAYSGAYNRDLYDLEDPFAKKRSLDDKNYAVDHFYTKLLNLPKTMHTETGRQLAKKRASFMQLFLKELKDEITGQIEW